MSWYATEESKRAAVAAKAKTAKGAADTAAAASEAAAKELAAAGGFNIADMMGNLLGDVELPDFGAIKKFFTEPGEEEVKSFKENPLAKALAELVCDMVEERNKPK